MTLSARAFVAGLPVHGSRVLAGLLVVLGALSVRAQQPGVTAPPLPVAACSSSHGDVQLTVGSPSTWGWLASGEPVFADDRVRTGSLSTAKLRLGATPELRLSPRTTVLLERTEKGTRVSLEDGELSGTLEAAPGASSIELRTREGGEATLTILGKIPAAYRLTAVQGGITVALLDGTASLEGPRLSLEAPGGPEVQLEGSHADSAPPPAPGSSSSSGRVELSSGQQVFVSHRDTRDALRNLLPAPALTAPAADSRFFCPGLVLALRWSPVEGARGYTVEVASEPGFEMPLWRENTLRPGSVFVPPAPARYFVRVVARDGMTLGGMPSAPVSFHCEDAPPATATAATTTTTTTEGAAP